jgi:hypothetical protein
LSSRYLCATSLSEDFGRRAFRRPLTEAERLAVLRRTLAALDEADRAFEGLLLGVASVSVAEWAYDDIVERIELWREKVGAALQASERRVQAEARAQADERDERLARIIEDALDPVKA